MDSVIDVDGVRSTLSLGSRHSRYSTFALSGVLARGDEQFAPIRDSLPGDLEMFSASGKRFAVDLLLWHAAVAMGRSVSMGKELVLVGASMGGQLAPFAVAKLRALSDGLVDYDFSSMRVILVDPACGLGSIADPLAHIALRYGATAAPLGGLMSLLGIKVPVSDDMLPQDDEISVDDKDEVKSQARKFLAGHNLSLLMRQTRWMIKTAKNGELDEAVESLRGLNVSYIKSDMGKSPIVQPYSVDWWKSRLPEMTVIDVHGAHCGFLQNAPEFNYAFQQALA